MSNSEVSVTPLNAQIMLFAADGAEFPEWETGEEPAVATDSAIMVATREDLDGDVTVRVETDPTASPEGEKVFERRLSLQTTTVRFGSFLANELAEVELPEAGEYDARVYVDEPLAASFVVVVLARVTET